MTDAPVRRTAARVSSVPGIARCAPAARLSLRGDLAVLGHRLTPAGIPLSSLPLRAARGGERTGLWLGPDEQLLLAPEPQTAQLSAELSLRLDGVPHALVDVSHRQCAFALSGAHVRELLNAGCPLDLDPGAFPIDMCTRTILAKAEVVLWRDGADSFRLEVWRSYAAYVSGFLAEAAREFVSAPPG